MSLQNNTVLKIDWATHKAAKYAVEHWHYSKTMPKSKLVKFGVWEDNKFIGVVIYGCGATSDLVKQYGLESIHGCELTRVALTKHKTEVSRIIAITLKLLKNQYTGLRLVVSFADPEQGHIGGIYKAGGWIYSGKSAASDEYIYKGKRWQGRSFRNKFKGMEKSPLVKVVKGSSKYRYLMPLDDEMRKQVLKLAKDYPKRTKEQELKIPLSLDGATPICTLQTTGKLSNG
jgi:hypothetical protein